MSQVPKKPSRGVTKSLLPPDFISHAQRQQKLKDRILTESRSIVVALSQGPSAPTIPELVDAARRFSESLHTEVAEVFGAGDHFNALRNLISEADEVLQQDDLATVGTFSAVLLACARYRPVRR